MLSEERIMEIAECCPVWYAIPQGREKALLTKFARAIEREAASTLIRNLEIEESEMTNESKQEDVRGMVPVYQIRPDRESWIDCTEKYYAEWKGDKRTLYTQPANCPRCAEKQAEVDFQVIKVAALEAESKSLKELFTVDKNGLTMADRYLDLKAENARLTKDTDEYKLGWEKAGDTYRNLRDSINTLMEGFK